MALQVVSKPDTRLCSAIPYLTRGGRVADVGTDHAYLPIYLVREGIVRHALACDINEGPLRSARANIEAAGLAGRVEVLLTDGLCGVEEYQPDDVMIFGMGGELIARILSDAPWLPERDVGLILQPMSRAAVLREWLLSHGFVILGETLTFEDKYYQTIYARKGTEATPYAEDELLLGRHNLNGDSPYLEGFLRHEIGVLERVVRERSRSVSASTAEQTRLLTLLKKRLEEWKK